MVARHRSEDWGILEWTIAGMLAVVIILGLLAFLPGCQSLSAGETKGKSVTLLDLVGFFKPSTGEFSATATLNTESDKTTKIQRRIMPDAQGIGITGSLFGDIAGEAVFSEYCCCWLVNMAS